MQIAPRGSILQYFPLALIYHLSLRPLFCLFLSGHLGQVLLNMYFANALILTRSGFPSVQIFKSYSPWVLTHYRSLFPLNILIEKNSAYTIKQGDSDSELMICFGTKL